MNKKSIHIKNSIKETKDSYIIKRYIRFGKFDLNHYKLNQNILLIKYPQSRGPVAKIRSTKISNAFKTLLHDLLDTQVINKSVQKKLNTDEMDLFELLITKSGLDEQLEYERQKMDVDDHIHRFELLRDQLVAGNNSRVLKDQLIEVIGILNSTEYNKKISDEDAAELIDIIK